MRHAYPCAVLTAAIALAACRSSPPEPQRSSPPAPSATPVVPPAAPAGDPLNGKFSLVDATAGIDGEGELVATIKTGLGALDCRLYEDRAPLTVANFVGLARGLRPFRGPGGDWVKRPAYDDGVFHRVVKGFMIQGGDWQKTGKGDPGYVVPDEIWPDARHDRRGLLCMANRGRNTNGAQFFITDGAAPHLDGGYTIFGDCGPDSVIEAIASVPVRGDRPEEPPAIQSVTVARRPAK